MLDATTMIIFGRIIVTPETRLLPAPQAAPRGKGRLWALLILLLLAALAATLVRPEWVGRLTGG